MKRTYKGQVFNEGDWVRIMTMVNRPLAQIIKVTDGGAFARLQLTNGTTTRSHASCLHHAASPVTNEVTDVIEAVMDTSCRISKQELNTMLAELDEINKSSPDVFVDIIPIEPTFSGEPRPSIVPADDAEEVYVTVYWQDYHGHYVVAGWPAPVWMLGDYEELGFAPSDCVRIWM